MYESGHADIRVRVEILRDGGVYGYLEPVGKPEVRADTGTALKMNLRGEFLPPSADIRWLTDRLRPVLTVDGTDYPVGVFIGTTPRRRTQGTEQTLMVEGYSVLYLAQRATMPSGYRIPAGTNYIGALQELLQLAGIGMYTTEDTDKALPQDRADWPAGTPILEVINGLLEEINYRDIWVDCDGIVHLSANHAGSDSGAVQLVRTGTAAMVSGSRVTVTVLDIAADGNTVTATVQAVSEDGDTVTAVVEETETPAAGGEPDYVYAAGRHSIISDAVDVETDYFDKANVFRAVCSSPDLPEPLVAEVENDDPESPFSTVALGVRIVETMEVDSVADLAELQVMAAQMRYRALQAVEKIDFVTALDPGHGAWNTIGLDIDGEQGIWTEVSWSMVLDASGEMRHTAERVVLI